MDNCFPLLFVWIYGGAMIGISIGGDSGAFIGACVGLWIYFLTVKGNG